MFSVVIVIEDECQITFKYELLVLIDMGVDSSVYV